MTSATLVPTFRDPAGSLSFEDDRAVRTIQPSSRSAVLDFIHSPFYARLRQRGDMVDSTVDDSPDGLRLFHPRVPIPTYPWEWTPAQWLAAAELTLSLGEEAIAEGWILKDASPLNILFIGSRPILVDVLSFERRDPAARLWLAYGQYIRTFLLPLIMYRLHSWPLALTFFKRDGYEPLDLYRTLRWSQRISRLAFWPITLPAWLEGPRHAATPSSVPTHPTDPELTADILRRSLRGLRRRTRRAVANDSHSNWADYHTTLSHYTAAQTQSKSVWLEQVFEEFHPGHVLDIGANTGEYSMLAAQHGARVTALERDGASADRLYRRSRAGSLPIQVIHADLARPTPAAGWETGESSALLARLEAQCELVMMLAVIHHLILMEQIPLPAILSLAHRLTLRHLIIEWVPVSDPMFQSLMRGREALYGALSEADLLRASDGLFRVLRQEILGNGRILFLFEKL